MSTATKTPEELSKITGVKFHSFRICCPSARTCECCDADIAIGLEGFHLNAVTGKDEISGSPVICVTCAFANGREAVLTAARKMVGERLADPEIEEDGPELWEALLAQFVNGQFTLELPATMLELVRMIDSAHRERAAVQKAAFNCLADSFDRRIRDMPDGIAKVGHAIADLESGAAAKLEGVSKTPMTDAAQIKAAHKLRNEQLAVAMHLVSAENS